MKTCWVHLVLFVSLNFPVPGFSLEPPKRVKELGKQLGQEKSREVKRSKKEVCQFQRGKAPCLSEENQDPAKSDQETKRDSENPN